MKHRRQASSLMHAGRATNRLPHYDVYLIGLTLFLVGLGLVMVASASVTVADRHYFDPLHYFWRQGVAVVLGLGISFIVIRTPLFIWQQFSVPLLMLGLFMLVLVLIPGVGREVNGSMRWISLGPFNLQSSEPIKICVITYVAGYLVRHRDKVMSSFAGFIRPVGVLILVAGLLLLEPDYGSAVVLFGTALAMLFMGGVPLSRFLAWVCAATAILMSLVIFSPYRMQRLTSFIDPWQDPFNSGFQLTQALIAFGRGDWFGVGLGNSVQKLFYLPEAHTDFVFAVFAEEFGLIGSMCLILAFLFLIWRAFVIAKLAEQSGKDFAAYVAYGVGTLIGLQAFINIGVNLGVLPTKGLTLPLISYGGNSMIVSCVLIALLVRVELENHQVSKNEIPGRRPVMSHERILIMAGGTGGHVYPALAVADYLRHRGTQILWLGTEAGLENRVVPARGYTLSTIKVSGLRGKGSRSLLLAPFKIVAALIQTMIIIRRFKPDAVLGMGGYVSGPGGIAAWLLRVPLYIHEQNAIAGLTNRMLAPFATIIMQGFPNTFGTGRVQTTGNPVREEIIKASTGRNMKGVQDQGDVCLLVLGGSLGARALNQTVPAALKSLPAGSQLQVWHQTGTEHLQQTKEIYAKYDFHDVRVEAFIDDMASAYTWADLVLCRAGALTLAELCVSGLAAVLVPYPYAVDDHQTANAHFLSDKGAAVLLPESELRADKLAVLLSGLCQARSRLKAMAERTRDLACVDATRQVAKICLGGAGA